MERLDEFDKGEWRDVCRRVRPELTDDDFDAAWNEFQAAKQFRNHN